MDESGFVILAAMGTAIVLIVVWALLGPRRRADESGHHVELAEATRRRDAERARAERSDDDA